MPEGSPPTKTKTRTRTPSKSHPKTTSSAQVSKDETKARKMGPTAQVGPMRQGSDVTEVIEAGESEREQYVEIVRAAETLVAGDADWQTFFREILGVDGLIRRTYKDGDRLAQFEKSPEFDQIQIMFAQLRLKDVPQERLEPTKMITVRLPISLHKALQDEATMRSTSLNKLCITKLLQVIDEQGAPQPEGNSKAPQPEGNGKAP